MRNCAICGSSGKRVIMNDYGGRSAVNAGLGEVGMRVCLFACVDCGHRYVDAMDLTQEWFDEYYLHRYSTDDLPYSDSRLASLADFIASHRHMLVEVLDIGGMDGELARRVRALGIHCRTAGVGTQELGKFDGVVLSHTLEHIYDVGAMMERIKLALRQPYGLLFVESPLHPEYTDPRAYDFHWQHVNKFRLEDIPALLMAHGFKDVETGQIDDYREYHCSRTVGQYAPR